MWLQITTNGEFGVKRSREGSFETFSRFLKNANSECMGFWPNSKGTDFKHFTIFLVILLVRSPKDGELLGLEWGMIPQASNIIFPDQNSGVRCQSSKRSDTI